jgi:AcrR family transcriptional regulator
VIGAFERLAAELLGYVHANQRLYHVLFHEAPGHQDQAMEPLRHLVAGLLSQAMDQGALTPTDAGVLAAFLLDGLHGAMLPLAHHDQPRVPASVGEILRRLLAPARPALRPVTPGPAQP